MSATPSDDLCRRCRKPGPLPGKAFHEECWREVKKGIAGIPPVYQRLRPITPARFTDGNPFLVILGECGTGKSVTAAEALENHARKTGRVPQWINCAEMLLQIRASFDTRGEETERVLVKRFAGEELLCVDDLAAEKVSDYSIATLYLILNRRGEYDRPTIITSNLNLDGISQKLDDRIANRLARYGNVITLTKNNVENQPTTSPTGAQERTVT